MRLSDRDQAYWATDIFRQWFYNMRETQQIIGHVTFRQVVTAAGFSNVDAIVNAFGGEGVEWWQDDIRTFGLIWGCKYTGVDPTTKVWADLTYKQSYDLIASMRHESRPWLVDILVNPQYDGTGIAKDDLGEFVDDWAYKFDSEYLWNSERIDQWYEYENRIIPYYPVVPTEEMVRTYTKQETEKATNVFDAVNTHIDEKDLDTFNWDNDANAATIKEVTDLYDRIERLWPALAALQ